MHRDLRRRVRVLTLAAFAVLIPAVAIAQAPPPSQAPVSPKTEPVQPSACAQAGAETTVGQGGGLQTQQPAGQNLSDKLARSDGIICPPEHVDPEIKQPTPPGGPMPVIPPPGSPGGDPNVRPK
jgi:hypothetical protein